MSTATDLKLTVTRFIKASRERVFTAWTTPEQIMRWFGPGNCYPLDVAVDPRKGGSYRIHMKTDTCSESGEVCVVGTYREVTPPSRLVFTWAWENTPGETLVTVDLKEVQGGTNVTITHEGFADTEACNAHEHGWNGSLDKLERRAEAMEECRMPGHFSWNELQTSDVDGASSFYTKLFGWEAAPMPGGMPYTLFKKDGTEVAGLMKSCAEGIPPHWLAYVTVANADASAENVASLGGKILAPCTDIPNVGRIAVIQDPQGAAFGIFQPI